jgi:hypothetical protein
MRRGPRGLIGGLRSAENDYRISDPPHSATQGAKLGPIGLVLVTVTPRRRPDVGPVVAQLTTARLDLGFQGMR